MGEFVKKPVIIEAITFEEFVEYGKKNSENIVRGMPWSFDYKGQPISHENDECYLIPTLEGTMKFTPNDMLITGVNGEIYPCKIDIFKLTYDTVCNDKLDDIDKIRNMLNDEFYNDLKALLIKHFRELG